MGQMVFESGLLGAFGRLGGGRVWRGNTLSGVRVSKGRGKV